MGIDQLCAGGDVVVVGITGVDARTPLDDDLVTALRKLVYGGGEQADAMLLYFDFLGDTYDHGWENFAEINGISEGRILDRIDMILKKKNCNAPVW